MPYLHEIKFVDLKHSKWDKQKSNPKKGKYVWIDKKYVSYADKGTHPGYLFRWNRNDPKDISDWEVKWRFSLVNVSEKLVYPEGGAQIDAEGHYTFGDCILMKITPEDYFAKRRPEIEQSERAASNLYKRFASQVKQDTKRYLPGEDAEKMVDKIIHEEIRRGEGRPLLRRTRLTEDTK